MGKLLPLLSLLSLSTLLITTNNQVTAAPPLYTAGRWIVDGNGQRVKLTCVNWAAHMEVMVAEGLTKQHVDDIAKNILALGFNCVRLTWPIFLVTDDSLVNVTVRQSFERQGLSESVAGLEANNPSIVDLPLLQALQAVVTNIAKNNVMIVLDNHVSKPSWCCDSNDGNGFFGDQDFDSDIWLTGLSKMATLFRSVSNVIGMSLRNELRGPRENVADWYKYMEKGAEVVHAANTNVLVILSGLNFDLDLSFLRNRTLNVSFVGKIVFERHWYGFSDGRSVWTEGNPNEVCRRVSEKVMNMAGFLLERGFPLFVSEFGMDQRGTNPNDNRYMDCFVSKAAEFDWDWALWSYVGTYYFRDAQVDMIDHYGIMDSTWASVKNSTYMTRISSIQLPFRGPKVGANHRKVIYHPRTGLCIEWKGSPEELRLGACNSQGWDYTREKNLMLKGTSSCIEAEGAGKPTLLSTSCSLEWEMISDSGMHLQATLGDGASVCLDVVESTVVTNPCKCISKDNECDPSSQWFNLVHTTV